MSLSGRVARRCGCIRLFFPGDVGHFFFHTSGTEWKQEFSLLAVGQDGMVEVTWREDFALDETKVLMDVRVTRL